MRQVAPPVWGPLLLAAAAVLSCLGYATGAVNVTRHGSGSGQRETIEALAERVVTTRR